MNEDSPAGSPELEPTEVVPPTRVIAGKYCLGRIIGEGGMGTVYEAEHSGLGVKVAIKLLGESFAEDQTFVRRFRREARAAAAVRHENVVAVTDTGMDEDGVPFLVMELLEGESLASLLRREKALAPEQAIHVASQILLGLAAAHQQGVVHRDLKPANVFLAIQSDGSQRVKILDFGISKFAADASFLNVTADGAVIGTPSYMSPEQVRGTDLDARLDLYAVGVLLYRMTTGKLPFGGRKSKQIYDRILAGNPTKPRQIRSSIPEPLETFILKAMAAEAARRYQDAESMLHDLLELAPHSGTTDPLPLLARSRVTPARRAHRVAPPRVVSRRVSGTLDHTGPTRDVKGSRAVDSTGPETDPASDAPTSRRQSRAFRRTVGFTIGALAVVGAAIALGGWAATQRWAGSQGEDGATRSLRVDGVAGPAIPADGQPLRYAVNRYEDESGVRSTHSPVAKHIQQRLGRPVELVVLEDYDLRRRLRDGELDLVALSAYRYVEAKKDIPELQLIATAESPGGPSYQGVLIAHAESGITTLKGLRGKVFCYVSETSASGYLYPRAVLRRAGLDPDAAFRATRITGDHLRSLHMLKEGACDGAAVFQGIFQQTHDFLPQEFTNLAHTPRIPHDAYIMAPDVPDDDVSRIRAALLELKRGGAKAKRVLGNGALRGFAGASDDQYDEVRSIVAYLDSSGR